MSGNIRFVVKPGPGYLVRACCRGQNRGPEAYRAWAGLLTGGMEAGSRDVLEAEGLLPRCTINTWSGELNEYLKAKYGEKVMIHAYFPQTLMGLNQKRFVLDYAYCVCMWGSANEPVCEKRHFDAVKDYGVEPWVYWKQEDAALYDQAIEYGAKLITANDPKWVMDYLRAKGLHK